MKYVDTFTQRLRKRERLEKPVPYGYDDFPDRFRNKAAYILADAVGLVNLSVWEYLAEVFMKSNGIPELNSNKHIEYQLPDFIQRSNSLLILDVLEIGFRFVDSEYWRNRKDYERVNVRAQLEPDEALKLLNETFLEYDLGYQFTNGLIIRIADEYLHAEVVDLAITLIYENGLEGALDAFMEAHRHYRAGENSAAIVSANNALESTLKAVLERNGTALTGSEKLSGLVDRAFDRLAPKYLKAQMTGLNAAMLGLSTLRNKTPGAGHIGSDRPDPVPTHVAAYAIHLAAANIVFLIESGKVLEHQVAPV